MKTFVLVKFEIRSFVAIDKKLEKTTTNRVRESSFNMELIKPKMRLEKNSNQTRNSKLYILIILVYQTFINKPLEFSDRKNNFNRKRTENVDENQLFFDTISAASIIEDEEGTNLNAKGINTDYVQHYNSINKTREEEKKQQKEKFNFSTDINACH